MRLFPDTEDFGSRINFDKTWKGWTPWSRARNDIARMWGPTRQVHWPKLNKTDHYKSDLLVGQEAWGVHGGRWRALKLPPGQPLYTPTPEEMAETDRKALEWCNARRAARGEPLLPLTCPARPVRGSARQSRGAAA